MDFFQVYMYMDIVDSITSNAFEEFASSKLKTKMNRCCECYLQQNILLKVTNQEAARLRW